MASRITYWSCTDFSDWVRGTSKLKSGTAEEWHAWRKKARTAHPVRNWLAEEALDKIQDIFYFPYDLYYDISCYISNRFVYKTHYLSTGFKPGNYY